MTRAGLTSEEALTKADFIPQFFGVCPYFRNKDPAEEREGASFSPWLSTATQSHTSGGSNDTKLRRSLCRTVYTVFLILVLIGFLAWRVIAPQKENMYSKSELNIIMMKVFVNCGTSIATLLASLFGVEEMEKAANELRSSRMTGKAYTSKMSFYFVFMLIILALLVVEVFIYEPLPYLELTWGFYLSSIINTACVDHFVGCLSVLRESFCKIREWILEPSHPQLEAAVCSFERLTTAAEYYNDAFGTQLLLIVGANFLLSTTNAFLIVSEDGTWKRCLFIFWCGASAAFPLRIVYAVDCLLQERNEFNNTLNILTVQGHLYFSPVERVSEKVRLHIAMKQELEFTARGFFTLDYGLINSMIGAVTTYLVILMQFNQ